MIVALTLLAAVASSPPHMVAERCYDSQLSIGERFIPRGASTQTVKRVAAVTYGEDTVGFVYQSADDRLWAQARSGMPPDDQRAIGLTQILSDHKTGMKYDYSAIVPVKSNPWRDLIVVFC